MKIMPPYQEWVGLLKHYWNQAFPKNDLGNAAYLFFAYLFLSPICYPLGRDQKRRSLPAKPANPDLMRETKQRGEFSIEELEQSCKAGLSWLSKLSQPEEDNSMHTAYAATFNGKCFIFAYSLKFFSFARYPSLLDVCRSG
jgi:hypothetical protein